MLHERFKKEIVKIESEWEGKTIQDLPYETLERYYHLRQAHRAYQGVARRRKERLG
jgi:hypothetical protein|tara:strand:+ start:139 stop:306 length:168 start_codon:yes stop_codon:yes gene_type:complete